MGLERLVLTETAAEGLIFNPVLKQKHRFLQSAYSGYSALQRNCRCSNGPRSDAALKNVVAAIFGLPQSAIEALKKDLNVKYLIFPGSFGNQQR